MRVLKCFIVFPPTFRGSQSTIEFAPFRELFMIRYVFLTASSLWDVVVNGIVAKSSFSQGIIIK